MFDHVDIRVSDRDASERFDAGCREDGKPGPRPQYVEDYYGVFLLDPDGNNVEVVNHHR